MFSKLLQKDTQDVTPSQAGATFTAEVNRLVREQGMEFSKAWQQVRVLEPGLLARLNEGLATPGSEEASLANEELEREKLTKDYAAAFKAALAGCNDDPLRAHAVAMADLAKTVPNLKDKFKVTRVA